MSCMRQSEQDESAVEQGALFHPTDPESPQIEQAPMPPKRRRRVTTDLTKLEFEPLDLLPKRLYRRGADRSKFEFELLDLPPKRPYRRRLATDLDASEDNNKV